MPGGVFLIAGVATSIASPKRRWICWWRQIVEDDARAVSILSSWSDDVSGGRLQVEIERARAPRRRSIGLQCDLDTADETCHRVGQLGFGLARKFRAAWTFAYKKEPPGSAALQGEASGKTEATVARTSRPHARPRSLNFRLASIVGPHRRMAVHGGDTPPAKSTAS